MFVNSVIKSALSSDVESLFYTNVIELIHWIQRKDTNWKQCNLIDLLTVLKGIVTRQDSEETRAIGSCAKYRLSKEY